MKILVEMEFIKDPKKLREIMYTIEKIAYDKAMSCGDQVTNVTAYLHVGHEVIVKDRLIPISEV